MSISVTTEQAALVVGSVLPPLVERIEDGYSPAAALTDAFLEGMRFAAAEIAAQQIEAGGDTRIVIDITPAGDTVGGELG